MRGVIYHHILSRIKCNLLKRGNECNELFGIFNMEAVKGDELHKMEGILQKLWRSYRRKILISPYIIVITRTE